MSDKIHLTDKEVKQLIESLRYSSSQSSIVLQNKLRDYKNIYIPKEGILAKEAFVVAEKNGSKRSDPLNYKVEINQVENVRDYEEYKVECIRKRYYFHPLKIDVFGTRIEAKLAGYKKHLNLFSTVTSSYDNNPTKSKRIEDMKKKLERQIYLIEAFPEKHI